MIDTVDTTSLSQDVVDTIINNVINESVTQVITLVVFAILAVILAVVLVLLFIAGYLIGSVISIILKRVLMLEQIQVKLVKYGATTTSIWKSIVEFLAVASKWLTVFAALSLSGIPLFTDLFTFAWIVYVFAVLVVAGLLLGSILYKVLKSAFVTVGLEEGLKKYNVADSFGGVSLSSILASIAKWYVFIAFITAGLGLVFGSDAILTRIMEGLMDYIPEAILGFFVVMMALIFGNFVGNRIKYEKVPFSDMIGLAFEIVFIFFGIVLALPKFGIQDVSILADSFKILMVGAAIGLAIALGFGLKDSVSRMAGKL